MKTKYKPGNEGDNEKKIVALKTKNNNETMDFYLTIKNRILPPLSNNDILIAVFSDWTQFDKDLQNKPTKKDFEVVKMIGKGGFSNVYQGIKYYPYIYK